MQTGRSRNNTIHVLWHKFTPACVRACEYLKWLLNHCWERVQTSRVGYKLLSTSACVSIRELQKLKIFLQEWVRKSNGDTLLAALNPAFITTGTEHLTLATSSCRAVEADIIKKQGLWSQQDAATGPSKLTGWCDKVIACRSRDNASITTWLLSFAEIAKSRCNFRQKSFSYEGRDIKFDAHMQLELETWCFGRTHTKT